MKLKTIIVACCGIAFTSNLQAKKLNQSEQEQTSVVSGEGHSGAQKVIAEIYNYIYAKKAQQTPNNQTTQSNDKPILEEKPPISLFPPQNHKLSFTYNDIETARWQAKARIKEFCKFYLQKINNILPCALTKEAGTVIIEAFEATGSPFVIQEGLEKTLNTFCNGVKKYNTVTGFSENITKKIIAAKHSKGYSLSNINGCIGEIQCANKLESIGETIVEFGKKIKGKYSSADFDVVTTTKVFESKNFSNWSTINLNSLRDQLGREAQIAAEYGKSLGLYSTNPIPESFKEWLIKKNILILEG